MAGFFGFFDYTKPGPGIDKDAPEKHRFFIFFEVLSRKFWKLLQLNMLYFLFSIPAFIMMLLFSMFLYQSPILPDDAASDLLVRVVIGSLFVCIPLIVVGPAAAGFNYVLRNFSNEEHAWVISDFKEHALKNFKQASIISLIDLAVCFIFAINLNFYNQMESNSILWSLVKYFLIMAFVLFTLMHLYIYPMIVTYKLSIKQLYKNALIFTMIKLFPSIGLVLLCSLIVILTFYFNMIIGLVLLPLFTLSLIGLIINFYVNRVMKRYIIGDDDEEEIDEDEAGTNSNDETEKHWG